MKWLKKLFGSHKEHEGPPPIPKWPPPPPPPRRPKPSSSGAGADTNLIRRRYERAR